MEFHIISDTHNKHKEFTLAGGDFLIHCGDCTKAGSIGEAVAFLNWFELQPYKHKIMIPGNHDWCFMNVPTLMKDECKVRGIVLLVNEGIELEGIRFWGSPYTPLFHDWAYMLPRGGEEIKAVWELIPIDTEVLITHGPAWNILDTNNEGRYVGCSDLFHRINKTDVKLHVCGHVHWSRGHMKIGNTCRINAASLDEKNQPYKDVPYVVRKSKDSTYYVVQAYDPNYGLE